jgi:hypothetical protein
MARHRGLPCLSAGRAAPPRPGPVGRFRRREQRKTSYVRGCHLLARQLCERCHFPRHERRKRVIMVAVKFRRARRRADRPRRRAVLQHALRRFVVLKVSFAAVGVVDRFAADFAHCEGSAAVLFGFSAVQLHVNSSIPNASSRDSRSSNALLRVPSKGHLTAGNRRCR